MSWSPADDYDDDGRYQPGPTSTTSATPERYLTPEQIIAIAEIIEKGDTK